jgi:hypothetical protein
MAQFWRSLLPGSNVVGVGAGSAYASSTTLTDVSPTPQITIAANSLFVGQRLRVKGYGIFSNTATPTLLLGIYYGGVAGTALAATGATTTTTGATSWPFDIELDILVKSVGATGSVWCNGKVNLGTSLSAMTPIWLPSTQTQPITINTTTANALTIGAQWGTNSASNTLTVEDFYAETLG